MHEIIREIKFLHLLLHWIGLGELSEGKGGDHENSEVYISGNDCNDALTEVSNIRRLERR